MKKTIEMGYQYIVTRDYLLSHKLVDPTNPNMLNDIIYKMLVIVARGECSIPNLPSQVVIEECDPDIHIAMVNCNSLSKVEKKFLTYWNIYSPDTAEIMNWMHKHSDMESIDKRVLEFYEYIKEYTKEAKDKGVVSVDALQIYNNWKSSND